MSPSASRSTQPSSSLAFLPRLQRSLEAAADDANENQQRDALSARLNRLRIEDRRRARNEQIRLGKAASSGSDSARAGKTLQPIVMSNSPMSSSSGSASSRAGTNYYSSSQIARHERMLSERDCQLRRKFAGPAPPTSWRPLQLGDLNAQSPAAADDKAFLKSNLAAAEDKRPVLAAAVYFFPDKRLANESGVNVLPSLVDATLVSIATGLVGNTDQPEAMREFDAAEGLTSNAALIPLHLKERMLSLCGRLTCSPPASEMLLNALFLQGGEETRASYDDTGESEAREMVDGASNFEEEEEADTWEGAFGNEADASGHSLSAMDLSFSLVSAKVVREILQSPAVYPNSLRYLSLAGWGSELGQGRQVRSLRSFSRLFHLMDRLTNLEVLSLAETRLLPPYDEADESSVNGNLTASATSEALTFLRKLARRSVRLRVLDLTACTWVNGAVVTNVGWYTTTLPVRRTLWPRLEHLVLTSCPAFSSKPGDRRDPSFGAAHFSKPSASPPFSGQWHAAHHGLQRATDSPYFLAHRPGLGRALVSHGVGAWDLAGRRGLIEKEVAALDQHRRHSGTPVGNTIPHPREGDGAVASSWAISHGSAFHGGPALSSAAAAATGVSAAEAAAEPPKCPVSGHRVERFAWERARVLDSVQGRWGSAILGSLDGSRDPERIEKSISHPSQQKTSYDFASRSGAYISVYF